MAVALLRRKETTPSRRTSVVVLDPETGRPGVRSRTASVHRAVREFVPADRVFAELDGQPIAVGGLRRRIEVFSIRDEEGSRWIQLALRGEREQMATLRLPAGEGAQRAFLTLSSWLVNPEQPSGDVLNVA